MQRVDTLAQTIKDALASRYEIKRPIGRGGMATVYLCRTGWGEDVFSARSKSSPTSRIRTSFRCSPRGKSRDCSTT